MIRLAISLVLIFIVFMGLLLWFTPPTDRGLPVPKKDSYPPKWVGKDSIEVKRGYGPKFLGHGKEGNEIYNKDEKVLEWEKIYVHGVLDSSTSWFGTGKLWSQTQYENGIRNGIHKVYKRDGKTINYIHYYENEKRIKKWDSVESMKKDSTIK